MRHRGLLVMALLMWNAPARASEAPPLNAAQDEDLLEFLGSLDDGDAEWSNYLATTDIAKVAKAAPPPPKPVPPRTTAPQGQSEN